MSVKCANCGYPLPILAHGATARCPECGLDVGDLLDWPPGVSARGTPELVRALPRLLRALRVGHVLLLCPFIALLLPKAHTIGVLGMLALVGPWALIVQWRTAFVLTLLRDWRGGHVSPGWNAMVTRSCLAPVLGYFLALGAHVGYAVAWPKWLWLWGWLAGSSVCVTGLVVWRILTSRILARIMDASSNPGTAQRSIWLAPRLTAVDVIALIVLLVTLPAVTFQRFAPAHVIPPVGVLLLTGGCAYFPLSFIQSWTLVNGEAQRRLATPGGR